MKIVEDAMSDKLQRVLCDELNLRAYCVTSLDTVRDITARHETTPNATIALGRAITGAALLCGTLKPHSKQSIGVKFFGDGPLKGVYVQGDALGHIRGYVENPLIDITNDIGRISFSKSIGAGFLEVSRDLGMKKPYLSILPLLYGEIASEIANFLTESDQVPSALIIGMNLDKDGGISSSGGILIQTFPDTDESAIELVEKNISETKMNLGDFLEEGGDILDYLKEIFDNHPIEVGAVNKIKSSCACNSEVLRGVLNSVDLDELIDMKEKDKGVEITCTFCKKQYNFNESDLDEIISKRSEELH
jgi:molecular chaperone Hsp33